MGKRELERQNDAARILSVVELRRRGVGFPEIAERLTLRGGVEEAQRLAAKAYRSLTFQVAAELRGEAEQRYDDLTRRMHSDLELSTSQPQRTALYALLLKTEQQRSDLLGLKLPAGVPDAEPDHGEHR